MALCKLASAFGVDVYPAHSVAVKNGCPVAGVVELRLAVGLLLGRERRAGEIREGGEMGAGTERSEYESSDHFYHYKM